MTAAARTLAWLQPGQAFPPLEDAWDAASDMPGLLCAGADLSVETLTRAYRNGIFPWFSAGQPVLWWSPEPRMVLSVDNFRLHPSLKKRLHRFSRSPNCEIRVDSAFADVIAACASIRRNEHDGTWIVPPMVQAYSRLHHAGLAHSVETWIDGELTGGLYFVAIGRAVFGESMFHRAPDSSKIALAALIAMCRQWGIAAIDCQQNTRHLASLGAAEMPRDEFVAQVAIHAEQAAPPWLFAPVYWDHILATHLAPS